MVALTFPDGARRDYPDGSTGLDVAKAISPSIAKRTVAMTLDGTLADLADPIDHDARIEFVSRDDPDASLPLDANVLSLTVMATRMPFVGRG